VGILCTTVIRYFCHVDPDGPRADFCARYAEAFLAIGERIRIIPVEFAQSGDRWKHLRPHWVTPLSGAYANVVCAEPFWWGRLYTVGVKNLLVTWLTPEQASLEGKHVPVSASMASGTKRQVVDGKVDSYELFEVPHELPDPRTVALRYQAIVVPTEEIARAWQEVVDESTTQVDHGEEAETPVCQVVVVGVDLAQRAQALRRVLAVD